MIALHGGSTLLRRFVSELGEQSPIERAAPPPAIMEASTADLEAAALGWGTRIVEEYRSVVVFAELLQHLANVEAPLSALCCVQRLLGDEIRHVMECARLAEAFGALDALAIDLSDLGLPQSSDPLPVRALEIVIRELVVGESESILALQAYRNAATDPACRRALDVLMRDEVRHAAAGRALELQLTQLLPRGEIHDLLACRNEIEQRDRSHIRSVHRAGATGGPGRMFGVSVRLDEIPPYGQGP